LGCYNSTYVLTLGARVSGRLCQASSEWKTEAGTEHPPIER